MSARKAVLFITATIAAGSAFSGECSLPEQKGRPADHPECLFFVGTQNFREENYAAAFRAWEQLRALGELPAEFRDYRWDAYNNLGYLHYMGMGVEPHAGRAIAHWQVAYAEGHEEAAYHLCHAHADAALPQYRPKAALAYCKEALRRYQRGPQPEAAEKDVARQLRQYIARLQTGPKRAR